MIDEGKKCPTCSGIPYSGRCPTCGVDHAAARALFASLVKRDPNEVVGHKTFATGETGPEGFPVLRHEPLTRAEADAIFHEIDEKKAKRAADMPTEEDAVRAMWSAYQRLRELGWKETMYLSSEKLGTMRLIEPGGGGIVEGHYDGEWPTGRWWLHYNGDLWPSQPCLGKPLAATSTSTRKP